MCIENVLKGCISSISNMIVDSMMKLDRNLGGLAFPIRFFVHDMSPCDIILGRPCEFDSYVIHDEHANAISAKTCSVEYLLKS